MYVCFLFARLLVLLLLLLLLMFCLGKTFRSEFWLLCGVCSELWFRSRNRCEPKLLKLRGKGLVVMESVSVFLFVNEF